MYVFSSYFRVFSSYFHRILTYFHVFSCIFIVFSLIFTYFHRIFTYFHRILTYFHVASGLSMVLTRRNSVFWWFVTSLCSVIHCLSQGQWRSQGGRGGATAPLMVPKTVLVESLNPGRNFRGGGRYSEQRVKSNYQTEKTYRWAIRMCLIIRVGFGIWLSMTSHIKSSKCVGQLLNVANCQCSSAMWLTHVLCVAFIDYVRYWCRFIVIIIGLGSRNLVVSCSYL